MPGAQAEVAGISGLAGYLSLYMAFSCDCLELPHSNGGFRTVVLIT